MFDNLSERLERSFKILKGEGRITEINIAETVKDIRKALLEADVNYKTAKQFTDQVKEKALGQNVITAVRPGQLMVKITHDELAALMGGEAQEINLKGTPAVILMAGLQGSGKTTFASKLANYLQTKKGKKVMLVACDVYRPAAIEQLRVLGEQIGAKVFANGGLLNGDAAKPLNGGDPVKIAQDAISEARKFGYDVVIVDTDDRLDFDGVVLTKLDGDARGGAALSIRSVVNKPIKFIGTGEKMEALDVFHPARMADRILGMGDVVSLVERAQEQYDEEEARRISKKIAKNQFDFNDFLGQLNQIKKMGSMKELMGMIPGMDKALKGVEVSDDAFKPIEAMINSMTPAERANPSLLNGSRKARIAKGAGVDIVALNRFLKQFEQTSKMMRKVQQMKRR